jgi:hypothetical protein
VPGHEGAKAKPSTALRKAVVTKMRDGEAGQEFAYRLSVVETGRDADGEAVTTCVVLPADMPKLDGDGLSSHDRAFMSMVRTACDEAGGRARLEEVRLRFYAAREGKRDAKRMAFNRALKAAIIAGSVVVDDQDIAIWIPSS